MGAPNADGVGKNCVFWPVENLCSFALVIGVHNGALAEEYAVWGHDMTKEARPH